MARTAAGRSLTAAHRRGQLTIRAKAIRDFQKLWPVWRGDEETFRLLVSATIPLVKGHRGRSGALAAGYFERFRAAEKVGGTAAGRTAAAADTKAIRTSLYVTGLNGMKRGVEAGFSPQAARQSALVQVTGAITRHVLSGARGAIVRSVADDRQAGGYFRVTGGSPCAFCALLATRGAVYSDETADFEAHDHCSCFGEPQYPDSEMPAESAQWWQLWRDTVEPERYWNAKRERWSWRNPPDAMNQFRQALAAKSE